MLKPPRVVQHIRKYLPELLNLIHEYWSYPVLLLPVSNGAAQHAKRLVSQNGF